MLALRRDRAGGRAFFQSIVNCQSSHLEFESVCYLLMTAHSWKFERKLMTGGETISPSPAAEVLPEDFLRSLAHTAPSLLDYQPVHPYKHANGAQQ